MQFIVPGHIPGQPSKLLRHDGEFKQPDAKAAALSGSSDTEQLSHWAKNALARAVGNGICPQDENEDN